MVSIRPLTDWNKREYKMAKKIRELLIKAYAHPGDGFLWGQFVPVLIASLLAIPVAFIWFDWASYLMWITLFVVIQIIAQPIARALNGHKSKME